MNNKKYKVIFSKFVVVELLERGFTPVDTFPNPDNGNFICYRFEINEQFSAALDDILSRKAVKGNG